MPLSCQGLWDADTTTAKVKTQAADQDRGGRGRNDARDQRVSPALRDARCERALEHRPGLAGVADDQDLWALGLGLVSRGPPEGDGKLRRQRVAGDPADAVGAEKTFSHAGVLTL